MFMGITGEGENREARFLDDDGVEWDAFIFKGRWCVGSGAVPAKLLEAV